MSNNTDSKTLEFVQEITKSNGGSKVKSNIMHFLIDYNVISNAVAFITALEIRLLISETLEHLENTYLGLENRPLIRRFVTVIGTLIVCYIFIQYIYYPFLYTSNIAKENVLKKALAKKEVDDTTEKLKSNNRFKRLNKS